ncbi:hypothetical protein [Microvirga puerhi]|uniref:AP2 domain-containing protein n=1 Tax=Microvirga puerhi TaxID=2876078 RepID=A0ABS7VTG1_9HYPH|nr:hypothetical protein [Microvirga puerhi]MBZ6078853.1 hypothetical protein [Microvirga puerhi]
MRLPRELQIPTGAVKVTHKNSSAVAYLYTNAHRQICAVAFYGKGSKPSFRFAFRTEAERERKISEFFQRCGAWDAYRKERRKEKAQPHTLEIGHILVSSWGYDQTNINFYQVTRIVGSHMVELREIGATSDATDWAMGRAVPVLDSFKGEPFRRRASSHGGVKINSSQYASVWDGTPQNWTSYA